MVRGISVCVLESHAGTRPPSVNYMQYKNTNLHDLAYIHIRHSLSLMAKWSAGDGMQHAAYIYSVAVRLVALARMQHQYQCKCISALVSVLCVWHWHWHMQRVVVGQ